MTNQLQNQLISQLNINNADALHRKLIQFFFLYRQSYYAFDLVTVQGLSEDLHVKSVQILLEVIKRCSVQYSRVGYQPVTPHYPILRDAQPAR